MSLTALREKQRYVVWAVAIILIPFFILSFTPGTGIHEGRGGPALMQVGDRKVTPQEFEAFLLRRRATDYGFYFTGQRDEYFYFALQIFQIDEARRWGLGVSPAEIGEQIRRRFPECMDETTGAFDTAKYRKILSAHHRGMTPAEFQLALEETILMRKFRNSLSGLAVASPLEAYDDWAMETGKVSYDELLFDNADYQEAARATIEDPDKAVTAYLDTHPHDRTLFQPGRWRLEYILAPFDAVTVPDPTEERIQAYYDEHKDRYGEKKLDAVRKEIVDLLRDESRKASAQFLMSETVDATLNQLVRPDTTVTGADVKAEKAPQIKFEQGRLILGQTVEPLLTAPEFGNHPDLGDSSDLIAYLEGIDSLPNDEARQKAIERATQNFNQQRSAARQSTAVTRNFTGRRGVIKVRVLEYQPGSRRDPAADADFRESILNRIVAEKASLLARDAAEAAYRKIREGAVEGIDFGKPVSASIAPAFRSGAGTPEETARIEALVDPELLLNEPAEPLRTGSGYAVVVLRARNVPPYEEFNKQIAETRARHRSAAANRIRFGDYRMGMNSGDRMRMWILQNQAKIQLLFKERDGNNASENEEGPAEE